MKLYAKLPVTRPREDYLMIEGRGVEEEIGDLLFGIVRTVKPIVCIETGTLFGDSAQHIGLALKMNGKGHLVTCDIDMVKVSGSSVRLRSLPIEVRNCTGLDLIRESAHIDFVHIDSGDPKCREEELRLLPERVGPGGIVCWHDATKDYENLYDTFTSLVDWPHLVFPSVVGMAVFQRPE